MSSRYASDPAMDFLGRHGMLSSRIDRGAQLKKLMDAMEADYLRGGQTGRMIPTRIGDYAPPQAGEKAVSVIDIGGTNVRSAVVVIGPEGVREIRNLVSFLTPGVSCAVDTADFYGEIARKVSENLVTDEIGICFSLATVPGRDRDAVMVAGGKQIKITDMLGKKVGESFRRAMADLGLDRGQRITVINDTVAAALGGMGSVPAVNSYSGFIGFIYGTGINLCYREKTGEWINTESAAYCTLPAGDLDDVFDRTLIDPGADRLEKMVSGGYQGGLMRVILEAAARENLISRETFGKIPAVFSSREISAFAHDPEGDNPLAKACVRAEDRSRMLSIIDAVTERSARICTLVLTAGMLRCKAGKEPDGPVFITAEGSTFLKQKDFREKLKEQMDDFALKEFGLRYELHTLPDVVLRGLAVACLSG